MESVFTVVGVVCALLISCAVLVHAVNAYRYNEAAAYYKGLLGQIDDTLVDIRKEYGDHDAVSAHGVKLILSQLRSRYWPDIRTIKFNDHHWLERS